MAERRMFSKTIVDSDLFLEMPLSAQCLYFHLSMRADDDGFVNSVRKIMRVVNASDDDFRILVSKGFVLLFESGVIVIKHWRVHNCIQKDRYRPTIYSTEKSRLSTDGNKVYSLDTTCLQHESNLDTQCIQDVADMDTQDRLGEVSLGYVRTDQERQKEGRSFEETQAALHAKLLAARERIEQRSTAGN
ncbi:replisome organizer [Ruminococcus albus SY3]|uniref:Replisome organizer n=1 Tax=Ruminococcus albus SY3 TaxID=1341156 RepID=A0A011UG11_RUMAL|nr:hypothetical protein [Ruminococcus albus]EXM39589.1 replisome organizer [Ruminococcus albus SY3]